eukprot:1154568-Pelagomonas_calceolata.AAC.4
MHWMRYSWTPSSKGAKRRNGSQGAFTGRQQPGPTGKGIHCLENLREFGMPYKKGIHMQAATRTHWKRREEGYTVS